MQVLTIAGLTFKEASRRKLLVALLVITAAVIGLTVWGFSRLNDLRVGEPPRPPGTTEIKLITSQLLILVMFAYSFVLALSAAFMATPSVAGELESGVALAILTRPVSRTEVLLGKWLGMAGVTTVYVWRRQPGRVPAGGPGHRLRSPTRLSSWPTSRPRRS